MQITPIIPIRDSRNLPPRQHAIMVIHHNEHTVVNVETGERSTLPPIQAWALYNKINIVV